jgi:hypothetical protein
MFLGLPLARVAIAHKEIILELYSPTAMGRHTFEGVEDLERLGTDLLRAAFPDLPAAAALRLRRMAPGGAHHRAIVEDRASRRRLLLKVLPVVRDAADAERQAQRMATEYHLLTEVAPQISEEDPAIGCPRAFAYLATPGVLALEVVDGPMLSTVLFGLRPRHEARRLRRLIERCGEWLGRFHALTRTDEAGNPFEWLQQRFEHPAVAHVCRRHGIAPLHRELLSIIARLLEAHRDLRVHTCMVHGVFAPYHVLVQGDGIRVIDLETARVTYPYHDLVSFDAYAAFRPPWTRAMASARLPLDEQRRALAEGYARHAGPFSAPERAVLALARVHALVRFALGWERERQGASPSGILRYVWWRRCLRRVWAEEKLALGVPAVVAPPRGR